MGQPDPRIGGGCGRDGGRSIVRIGIEVLDDRRVRLVASAIGCTLFASLVVVGFSYTVAVIGLLLIACLAVAVFRFPVAALVMLLFLQPFHSAIIVALQNRGGLTVGPLRHWEDALILVLFVRALGERLWKDRRFPLHSAVDNVVMIYVLAYVVLAVASPPRSTVPEALAVYTEGPLLFLAIRFLRLSRRELWMCVVAFVAAATVMGGAAIFERLGPHEGFLRWYGVEEGQVQYSASADPYRSASFLIDTLILAFYLAGTASFSAAVASIQTRWRPLGALAFAACAGGLICTVTRSGYIGGAVGVILVLLMVVRNPRSRLGLIGLTIVVVGGLSLQYVANGTLTRGEGDTAHKNAIERDLNFVVERPLGYGLGSTDRFRFREGASGTGQLGATESTYMARAIEGGVQGLLLYLIVLYVLIFKLRSVWLRARWAGDLEAASMTAGAIGVIVAVALSGLFLGVLERVVELPLWAAPAFALSWHVAHKRSSPVDQTMYVPSRAHA
jgi:hypothetical protein